MDSDSDSDSSDSSHNSDCSKDLPFDFKVQQGSTAERNQPQPEPGSGSDSDSSGLSSKSDRSKGCPFDFNNQRASAAESQGNRETPYSAGLYIEPSSIEDEGEEVYLNLQLTLGTTDEDKQKPDEQCQTHKRLKDFYRLWIEPAKQKGSVRKRSMSGDHESHTEAQRKKMKSKYSCVSAEKYIGFQKKQRPKSQGNRETPYSAGLYIEPSSIEDEGEEVYLNLQLTLGTTDEDKQKPDEQCQTHKRSMSGKHESQTRAQRNQPGAEAGPSSRLDSDSRGQYKEFQFDVQQASATERYLCPSPTQILPPPFLFSHHQFPQPRRGLSSGQLDTSNLVGPGLDDEQICIDSATERFIRLEGDLNRQEELEASMETFSYPIVEVCNEDPDLENAEVLDLNDFEVFERDELDDY